MGGIPQSQAQQRSQVTALLSRVQALDAQRLQMEAEKENAMNKLFSKSSQLKDTEKDRQRLSEIVAAKDREITKLKETLLSLEQKFAVMNSQIQSNAGTIDGLNNKLISLTKKLKSSDEDVKAFKQRLQESQSRLLASENQADKSKADVKAAEMIIDRLKQRLAHIAQGGTLEAPSISTNLTNKEVELLLSCGGWDPKTHSFNTDVFHYSETPSEVGANGRLKVLDAVEEVTQMQADVAALTASLRQGIAKRRRLQG